MLKKLHEIERTLYKCCDRMHSLYIKTVYASWRHDTYFLCRKFDHLLGHIIFLDLYKIAYRRL